MRFCVLHALSPMYMMNSFIVTNYEHIHKMLRILRLNIDGRHLNIYIVIVTLMKDEKKIKVQEIADKHLKNMMLKCKFYPVIRCHDDKSDHICLET